MHNYWIQNLLTYHCKLSNALGLLFSNESLSTTNSQASDGHSIARPVSNA